jgi:hypothetical protein
MRVVFAALLAIVLAPPLLAQQQPAPPAAPAGAQKGEPAPPPAVTSSVRTFTAPMGIIMNAVRPERASDFEKVVAYLQTALSASTDGTVRAQAQGWRVLKASEPGPNGTVLYVFLFDPAVPGADYGLGRILADAFPDQSKLQEIWKLYTDSLASGGSLLNLTPLAPPSTAKPDSQPPTPK